MHSPLRIGTRGSRLALWQAGEASRKLSEAGFANQIITVTTTGDKRQDVPLAAVGGKGLFIKELEEALERGTIDVAVHSLKDVPSIVPPQFVLTAFLERADPRDAWLHPQRTAIGDLPAYARVGTSAPRRQAQLLDRYPHLQVEPIRGNVETRVSKAVQGQFAGVVLASAGLTRLGRAGEITSWFAVDEMIPAAGQGIVVIETLAGNSSARKAAAKINDPSSQSAALCERGVLQRFGTRLDCYSAVAVHAVREEGTLTIRAYAGIAGLTPGRRSIRVVQSGTDAESVIDAVYAEMIDRGAMELLDA